MLDILIRQMNLQLEQLMADVIDGIITIDEFEQQAAVIIENFHRLAIETGLGGQPLNEDLEDVLITIVAIQLDFLARRVNAIRGLGFTPEQMAYIRQYANALRTSYSHGDVVNQSGFVLLLPAYPGEGTICGANCKCFWRIETLEGEGNFNCFWMKPALDSCATCIDYQARFRPFRIRNFVPVG